MKEFFLEIGTEETPAGFVPKALEDMETLIRKEFSALRIRHGEVKSYGTPRRLVLSVFDVADRQDDISMEVMGPARKAAYDDRGNPMKAAEGFARSQGVAVSVLKIVNTPKGEYLAFQKEEKGRKTADMLREALPRLVSSIPFRKSMRWGDLDVRFARPVHWIVALYGGKVIPFTFGHIESGDRSSGHRFMAPKSFKVKGLSDYLEKCENAFVIVDQNKRKAVIREWVGKLTSSVSGRAIEDEELLDSVTFLVEYPVALLGGFEKGFLALPKEVLITSMREHQKYFSVVGKDGRLLPYFIAVSNTRAKDAEVVKGGNERVLRARLSDARFFYEEDRKIPLRNRIEKLKGIVFQARLGTSYEKMERFTALTGYLADIFNIKAKGDATRAAYLCKADLVTGMVGEFPKLQGIMGREYARFSGEGEGVATAIYEHYLPSFAGDRLPSTDAGAFLSIADRIDTICGCFGIGQIPTGAADPYALRRHAISIINIILDRNYKLSISKLLDKSLELLGSKATRPTEETKKDVTEFIRVRLQNILADEGYPADVVDAVLSAEFDDVVRSVKIVKVLSELKKKADFEPLATTFKRAVNITKGTVRTVADTSLFRHATEKKLYDVSNRVRERVSELAKREDYNSALLEVATLKAPVDTFFDTVLIMDKDEGIRNNRLALLWEVSDIFSGFADFSKIVTTQ